MRHLALLAAVVLPSAGLAHPGPGVHGGPFGSGLLHPFLGPDHLLAMVAVGLLAAITGGRALVAYPASFLGAMVLGGALGVGGAALPVVEPVILASVVLLGAATAWALRPPLPLACLAIGLMGVAHGYAHGLEGPASGGLAYAGGVVLATAALHGLGLGLGAVGRPVASRLAGGLTCAAGLALVLG